MMMIMSGATARPPKDDPVTPRHRHTITLDLGMSYEDDEIGGFLSKVDHVKATIDGLVSGEIGDEEYEAAMLRVTDDELSVAKRKAVVTAPPVEFRSGSGRGDQYAMYCRPCGIEHDYDVNECGRCGKSKGMETRAERQSYLRGRVDELMEQRERCELRKKRWSRYVEYRKAKRTTDTDYERWDVWEPDTDSDDEPVPERDDPRFAALEADMCEREQRYKEKKMRADAFNKEGNTCFANRQFVQATEWYTQAIAEKKDAGEYYTNRAIAYLNTQQYSLALIDCDAALDMAEFLDQNRWAPNKPIVLKAWLRRAMALRELQRFDQAIDALENGALRCHPGDAQALEQLELVRRDMTELGRANAIKGAGGMVALREEVAQLRLVVDDNMGREVCMRIVGLLREGAADARTLFRALRGFDAIVDAFPRWVGPACAVMVEACHDNNYNLERLFKTGIVEKIVERLDRRSCVVEQATACISVLFSLSSIVAVRKRVTEGAAGERTWRTLKRMIDQTDEDDGRTLAVALLSNCALQSTFRVILQGQQPPVWRRMIVILSSRAALDEVREHALAAISNLLQDPHMRAELASSADARLFHVLVGALPMLSKRARRAALRGGWLGQDALSKCLGVVINTMSDSRGHVALCNAGLVAAVADIADNHRGDAAVEARALSILGRCAGLKSVQESVVTRSLSTLFHAVQDNVDNGSVLEQAVRALAACSTHPRFVERLYECAAPSMVRACFVTVAWRAADVEIVGNLCLCISRCADACTSPTSNAALFEFAGAIPAMVEIVRNSDNSRQARRNVAIAAAKLSRHEAILVQLREQRAIEMLMATASQLLA